MHETFHAWIKAVLKSLFKSKFPARLAGNSGCAFPNWSSASDPALRKQGVTGIFKNKPTTLLLSQRKKGKILFMQSRPHVNSRYESEGRGLTGAITFELAGDDRERGCMFSINLISSFHTYALLTKLVRSRWLGIGQVFQHFYGTRCGLGR